MLRDIDSAIALNSGNFHNAVSIVHAANSLAETGLRSEAVN
jgi:hypothetical protein